MIYVIILFLLALAVYLQTMSQKKGSILFIIASVGLGLMSGLRYGSGSDFFPYLSYYNNTPPHIGEAIAQTKSHMNIGYRIYMSIFRILGANSDIFIFCTSILVMTMFVYVIYKNSKYKMLSLLVFYGIYYSIYLNSVLRQGIALAIFFIAFYTFLKRGEVLKYCICIAIGFLFHESILITLILPIIQLIYKKTFYNKSFNTILCLASLVMFVTKFDRVLIKFAAIIKITIPYEASTFNTLGITLRIVSIAFIYYIYINCDDNDLTDFDRFQIYSYFIGILIYFTISHVPIFSRFIEYFSALEVIIYANLIYHVKSKFTKVTVAFICTLIVSSICIKDITSFSKEVQHKSEKLLEYPYVTIFNKKDIFDYINIEDRYIPKEFKRNDLTDEIYIQK